MRDTTIPTADPKADLRRAFAKRLIREVPAAQVQRERAKLERERAAGWAAKGEFHWAAGNRRGARYWDSAERSELVLAPLFERLGIH